MINRRKLLWIILLVLLTVMVLLIIFLFLRSDNKSDGTTEIDQPEPIGSVTLSFSGDVIQHMPQLRAASNGDGTYDFSRVFEYIDTVWKSVDWAVVNYETTISADGKYTGFPMFSSPPDVARDMYASGVRIAALANNHSCDKGRRGIENTIHTLDSLGYRTLGVYANDSTAREIVMLKKGPFRVALLNYTYGTNGVRIPKGTVVNLIDTVKMRDDILRARADSAATHVVAFVHWGQEYQRKANREQVETGMWLRRNGVDVVVGSHPHVVQQIDTANRIVYSLGNFISNQQDRYTDSGLTVVVTLDTLAAPKIEYVPHWCDKFAPSLKEKYRVLTPRDTVVVTKPENLKKMKSALNEARQAVGQADEYKW